LPEETTACPNPSLKQLQIADPLLQDKAVVSLRRYSFIEISGNVFSVHRLVQSVVREHLPTAQKEFFCKVAVQLVSALMPTDTADPRSWPILSRLAPHALAVWEHTEDLKVANEATTGMLNTLGTYFLHIGDFQNAKPVLEQALEINRKTLGEEHLDTAIILNNLGILLNSMGEYAAARPYLKQALEINRKVLGEEHPETAQSFGKLGSLAQAIGDYAAARPYLEQALEIRRKVLGEEHPDTAKSLGNLGFLLRVMGEYRSNLDQRVAAPKESKIEYVLPSI
jgi:tetratricopeptide (TPR) repeat protein